MKRYAPIHPLCVAEGHDEFIHDSIGSHGPTDELDLAGRILRDEMFVVEAIEVFLSDSTGHGGNVIYTGFFNH